MFRIALIAALAASGGCAPGFMEREPMGQVQPIEPRGVRPLEPQGAVAPERRDSVIPETEPEPLQPLADRVDAPPTYDYDGFGDPPAPAPERIDPILEGNECGVREVGCKPGGG